MSARRARMAAVLLACAAVFAAMYVLVVYVGPVVLQGAIRAVVSLPDALIWLLVSLSEGADWVTIAGEVAIRVAGALTRPPVIMALIAVELVGAAALYALKRLLRDEASRAGPEEVGR